MIHIQRILVIAILVIGGHFFLGGQEVISFINPSFEGSADRGESNDFFRLNGWQDCRYYDNETPPDVHSFYTDYFHVSKVPFDKNTFVGMVARASETNESIGQKLVKPLTKDHCYQFSIYLCLDLNYRSKIRLNGTESNEEVYFNEPLKLIIWGSNHPCGKDQRIGETEAVKNSDWQEYSFNFTAEDNYGYITLEAYWVTPVLIPYNGNLLLDKLSPITQYNCGGKDPSSQELALLENKTKHPKKKPSTPSTTSIETQDTQPKTIAKEEELKSLEGMDVDAFINSDVKLRIKDLTFAADTFNITPSSYPALDDIYLFLYQHPSIKIEIAGHTNSLPPHAMCDALSLKRALAVKNYLIDKGISPDRMIAKGFGKRKPLVSNKTAVGRAHNQRVEIKILKK